MISLLLSKDFLTKRDKYVTISVCIIDINTHLNNTYSVYSLCRTYQSSSSQGSSGHGSPANLRHLQQSSPDIRGAGGQQNGRLSTHSSLGSMGRSPGTSPFHLRSHDTRNRSDSSPSHMRPTIPQGQSVTQALPSSNATHLNTGQPTTQSHSNSSNQQRTNVSGSIPSPSAHQDEATSDSSPPQQPYRRKTSETLNHMQSDPQVPMLIQQIDELMGGLLDSPVAERKERPSAAQSSATNGVVASENPFLSNINPADFLRDEDIKIDPRNFLNTPSPEPNLLDFNGTTASANEMSASGVSTGAFQPSPLVSGVLSSVSK